MTNFVLKILDLFRWAYRLLGIDYPTFRSLMWAKLTVDNRQEKAVAQRRGKKEISKSMLITMAVYAFIGIFIGLILIVVQSLFASLVFVFSGIMIMATVALISDFSSVLLDTTDNAILLPRPIDSRTLAVARITLSLSLFAFIVGTIKYGPVFTLAFFTAMVLSVLFVVFLSNVFYFLLLKISDEEHLRDIILYFQIFMAAFAMASYQLLPRLMRADTMQQFTFPMEWWAAFIPPAWMAALVDMFVKGDWGGLHLILSGLGFAVSLICIILVVRILAPGFSLALTRMGLSHDSGHEKNGGPREKRSLISLLARAFVKDKGERGVFKLTWRLTGRDRKFKLRVYPTFGYILVIAFVFSVFSGDDKLQTLRTLGQTKKYFFFLYSACLILPSVMTSVRFSDHFEAAWIFQTLPFERPGLILRGSLKAMLVKFGGTVFVFFTLLVSLIWGPGVLDDAVLAAANLALTSLVFAFLKRNDLPFSKQYGLARDAQKGVAGFLLILFPAALGGIHFGLTYLPFGIPLGIMFSGTAVVLGMMILGNVTWKTISH
jgi:ABC-2 type transport system permease protein